jgi:hypothetical protein
MARFRYLVFGLRIESVWPIPSLMEWNPLPGDEPDVEILEGEVPNPEHIETIDGIHVNVEGDRYYLGIDDCSRFLVIGGRKIIVQPEQNATRDQVNLFLLGSIFGTLLHQRGTLPFHCNAVETDGSAFLFCGDSGAGKSTLAAYFVDRGYRLLSDDLCALDFADDGRLVAAPGVARLKLWRETLDLFGRSPAGLKLVPWYDDKYELTLKAKSLADSLPVAGLYHLRIAEEERVAGIHPVKGLEAANAVTANIYRRRLADLAGAAPFYLATTGRIIDQVPIFTINRTWGLAHFRAEAEAVEEHMRQLARGDGPLPGTGSKPPVPEPPVQVDRG